MEQHLFECPVCNSKYSLFRAKGNLREQNHKKGYIVTNVIKKETLQN